MHRSTSRRRRTAPAPVDSHCAAVELLTAAAGQPLRSETFAILLDDCGHGEHIVAVGGTDDADAVLDVAAFVAEAGRHAGGYSRLLLASVRPDGDTRPDDVDRWLDVVEIADEEGLTLVGWYVIHPGGFSCPRELVGEPPRW